LDVPDGEQGPLTPRDAYNVIKPGQLESSALWHRITTDDERDRMPPKGSHKEPLSDREIALFEKWIREGGAYQLHWAFVSPESSTPAKVERSGWSADLIDNRVMATLEQKGLQPKEEADKRTLIRRATFDLTGLPPSPSEIDSFLRDANPHAYANLVDRLLALESYGEHMARYWADLVRLADTNGMHKDYPRDFSTYRDWLIRSFNSNLPFDEFITYQLAGDLYEEPSQDQLIASGFNRLHLIIDIGTALPEESLHKNILDRVEAFGTTFLGMTVQCAQCHDHKYDPISQREYYQLYAFFNNFSGNSETERDITRGLQAPFINLTTPEEDQALAEFELAEIRQREELATIQESLENSPKWPKELEEVAVPWIWSSRDLESESAEFRTTLDLKRKPAKAFARFVALSEAEVKVNGEPIGKSFGLDFGITAELSDVLTPGENVITAVAEGDAGFAFILEYDDEGERKTFSTSSTWQTRDRIDSPWEQASEVHTPEHEKSWTTNAKSTGVVRVTRMLQEIEDDRSALLERTPGAMIMKEKNPIRPATVLARGAYDAPGEIVERNTPAFLPSMREKDGVYSRMDLAEWLVAPNHPLTARVAVNRIWQQFFGVGLVKTSEDFGAQGEWPSHPVLLDTLAVDFVESGWDTKNLVRQILLSNTYKQSSDATPEEYRGDPENRLLARGSRYRMDAEMIRDQILAVSGQLNKTMYGRSVKPPQPPGLWEMVSMAEPSVYIADEDANIYRRSLYTYWRRAIPPPQMTIMNAPSREYCVARRERTNTSLQALLLMNEEEYFKAAKACARLMLRETDDVDKRLSLTYETITSHKPNAARLELMKETLLAFMNLYDNDPALTESLTPDLNASDYGARVELAAWTMMTHSLLNLELAKVRR
jgi:hypothetical protein